jgi:hypothetical protein
MEDATRDQRSNKMMCCGRTCQNPFVCPSSANVRIKWKVEQDISVKKDGAAALAGALLSEGDQDA